MLEDFCQEVRVREHFKWFHWNTRDGNYGFVSLENRLQGRSVAHRLAFPSKPIRFVTVARKDLRNRVDRASRVELLLVGDEPERHWKQTDESI